MEWQRRLLVDKLKVSCECVVLLFNYLRGVLPSQQGRHIQSLESSRRKAYLIKLPSHLEEGPKRDPQLCELENEVQTLMRTVGDNQAFSNAKKLKQDKTHRHHSPSSSPLLELYSKAVVVTPSK